MIRVQGEWDFLLMIYGIFFSLRSLSSIRCVCRSDSDVPNIRCVCVDLTVMYTQERCPEYKPPRWKHLEGQVSLDKWLWLGPLMIRCGCGGLGRDAQRFLLFYMVITSAALWDVIYQCYDSLK